MALIDEVTIKPAPDFPRFRKVLLRQGLPDRVPFYELFADKPIKDKILGKPCPIALIPWPDLEQQLQNEIEYWRRLGFDYVPATPPFLFVAGTDRQRHRRADPGRAFLAERGSHQHHPDPRRL